MAALGPMSLRSLALLKARLFVTPVEIWRQTQTPTEVGGTATAWGLIGSFGARLRRTRTHDYFQTAADRRQATSRWSVLLPIDAPVLPHDRLVAAGLTFDVLGVDAGRADAISLVAHCLCVR